MAEEETGALAEFNSGWDDGWVGNPLRKKTGTYKSAYAAAKKSREEKDFMESHKQNGGDR